MSGAGTGTPAAPPGIYDPAAYNLLKYRTELLAMLSQDAADDGWTPAQLTEWLNRAIRHLWRWLVRRDPGFQTQTTEVYPLLGSEIEDPIRCDIDVFDVVGLTGKRPYPHVGESTRRTGQTPARGWWVDGTTLYVTGLPNEQNQLANPRDFTAWTAVNGTVGVEPVACLDRTVRTTNLFTAAGADAALLQTAVLDAGYWSFALYLKRKTGAGLVQITLDGGVTWANVTIAATRWTRALIHGSGSAFTVGVRVRTAGDAVYLDAAALGRADLALFEYLAYPAKLAADVDTDTLPDELRDWIVPVAHALALSKEEETPGAEFIKLAEGAKAFIKEEFPKQLGIPTRYAERDLGSYDGFGA
jgi:hypothetical protein